MKTGDQLQLNILVIDTSTDIELLCVSVKGRIYQNCSRSGISHSITMFGNLSNLLNQASIGINDINLIGTGIGPGSFTGIRIAVSTARMFSQILKVPLVGLKSPEIFAASVQYTEPGTVIAAFDAKKSRVFAGVYRQEGSKTMEIIVPGDYFMKELLKSINNPDGLTCIGDGCGKYIDVIEDFCSKTGITYKFIEDFLPDGKTAAELTLAEYNKSPDKYADYKNTVPFYSRLSDAEIVKTR
jgi:tRNA threonylcarbamoyl adenosine modification protein YeaZ